LLAGYKFILGSATAIPRSPVASDSGFLAPKMLMKFQRNRPQQDAKRTGGTHTRLTALRPGLLGWAGTRKVKTNLDFTEARDSEWQWHQQGYMQVCTSLQIDNHTSTTHHSVFYRPDALSAAQPTASKH